MLELKHDHMLSANVFFVDAIVVRYIGPAKGYVTSSIQFHVVIFFCRHDLHMRFSLSFCSAGLLCLLYSCATPSSACSVHLRQILLPGIHNHGCRSRTMSAGLEQAAVSDQKSPKSVWSVGRCMSTIRWVHQHWTANWWPAVCLTPQLSTWYE